ncbi:MAG: hypothetical protein MI922_27730, partial [Bacteroidales bacterium]|nr:hypothetical protein [Bacteroidales bacterium]
PPFFMSASHWMQKIEHPLKSGTKSRNAVMIPLMLIQYGSLKAKLACFKTIKNALLISLSELRKSAKQLVMNPKKGITHIDAKTLAELQDYALKLGVSKIGFTKVNPNYIFKDFEILYPNAMMLLMEMDRKAIKTAPSNDATNAIWHSYSNLGLTVNKLANFLRKRGINCHPSPAIGGDVNTVPIAEEAGLGAIGKNGLLITPEFGPSHRLAAVFIDVENLPLKSLNDNEHLWIKNFCDTCNKCVKRCPGKAIYPKTKILDDGYPKYIDREKCAPPFSKNCCTCIFSCPFINGNYDKIKLAYNTNKKEK